MSSTDTHATIEELLEAVFSVRSILRLYNKGQLPLEESSLCVMFELVFVFSGRFIICWYFHVHIFTYKFLSKTMFFVKVYV
jgi:hypothetical protein